MTTYSKPFLIVAAGVPSPSSCLQANDVSEAGLIVIEPVDWSGKTLHQQWVYGSDRRIYLYAGGGDAAMVPQLRAARKQRPSGLSGEHESFGSDAGVAVERPGASTLTNVGATGFAIDLPSGNRQPDGFAQIWQQANNANQTWVFEVMPNLLPA